MRRRDFMMAVGASVALALTKTKAQGSIRRPRLLISSTDPFTGLALLKTRYAAGLRPSDDMEGWSLSWQLTRDNNFAEKALAAMRANHITQGSKAFALLGRLRPLVIGVRLVVRLSRIRVGASGSYRKRIDGWSRGDARHRRLQGSRFVLLP